MKKILSIISAIIIVVIIALFLLVKFYITPDRIKAFLIPAAEEALNRKVNIEEISISLFKGIEARNFSIKESDGKTDFLKSKEFILKYKLLPLLSKKIIIDELRVISPEIRIVRDKQGKFNFENIGAPEKKTVEKEEAVPEGLPVSLLVSRLVIDDARFHFIDRMEELPEIEGVVVIDAGIRTAGGDSLLSKGSIDLTLNKVLIKGPPQRSIKNITAGLKYEITINPESDRLNIKKADLKVQDISASLTGDLTALRTSPKISIAVSLPETKTGAIVQLAGLFTDIKDIRIKGDVSSDLKIRGRPDNLEIEGHIALAKVMTVYKDVSTAIDGAMNFRLVSDSIRIKESSFTIQNIPVSIKGKITDIKKTPAINLDLSISKSKAENLLSAVKPFVDVKDTSVTGDIKADLNLRGIPSKIRTLKASGSINLINIGINYKDLHAFINSSLTLESGNILIDKADLKIEEVPVSVTGLVRNVMDSPSISISMSLPVTEAGKIQKLVSNFSDLKNITLSGRLGADLRIKGRPDKIDTLKAEGRIQLQKLGIKYNNIDAVLNGDLKIAEKSIDINLSAASGRNKAQIKGTVTNYMKNQDIRLNIYSRKLYIDELEPMLQVTDKPSPGEAKQSKGTLQRAPTEAEPVDLKLTASGEVKVDSAVYKGMDINDFNMKYSFKNNRLNLTETGRTGKGRFNIKTLLDLSKRGYKYTMSGNVDSIYVEEVINAFFPKAKDTIFGILTSDFRLNGAGTLPGNMKKNLVADGDFVLREGKITNIPIAKELSLLFNIRELETINLDQARGTVNINNGTARLDSLFTSADLAMDPKGDIGLEGELDLAFDIKLSPRLTRKAMSSNISQYLKDEQGWSSIPIICPGTFEKPACGPDPEKAVKQVIGKEINKFLNKLLNKGRKKEQPQQLPEKGERKEEPANPLEDLLKQLPGLFE